jgi:hypothetical protein
MPQEPSNGQLDALILSCALLIWLKVGRLLFLVGDLCEEQKLRFDPDVVASRIAALARDGSLESTGDLTRWQHGEVRLPGVADPAK